MQSALVWVGSSKRINSIELDMFLIDLQTCRGAVRHTRAIGIAEAQEVILEERADDQELQSEIQTPPLSTFGMHLTVLGYPTTFGPRIEVSTPACLHLHFNIPSVLTKPAAFTYPEFKPSKSAFPLAKAMPCHLTS
jgi:hypothetical protein